jgi:hypothetical protein
MFGVQHKRSEYNCPFPPPSGWSGGTLDIPWTYPGTIDPPQNTIFKQASLSKALRPIAELANRLPINTLWGGFKVALGGFAGLGGPPEGRLASGGMTVTITRNATSWSARNGALVPELGRRRLRVRLPLDGRQDVALASRRQVIGGLQGRTPTEPANETPRR